MEDRVCQNSQPTCTVCALGPAAEMSASEALRNALYKCSTYLLTYFSDVVTEPQRVGTRSCCIEHRLELAVQATY